MKLVTNTIAAALCAGGLALATGAQAQPAGEGMHGPGHMGMHHGEMRGGHHGDMRGEMHAFRALDLTEAQRDQIFKIHHEQAPAFRDQMKKVRASREELHKLAVADRLDQAAVRRAADAQAKAMSDLAVMHVTTQNRVRQLLTPEQRTKLDQMRQEREKRRDTGPGPR